MRKVASALLFDRERVEELEEWQDRITKIERSSILWIDLESPGESELRALHDSLGLSDETDALLAAPPRSAELRDFGSYVEVTTFAPSDARERRLHRLTCLVSERWVVTVHDAPVEMLETVRARASGTGQTGSLTGLEFLANILEWTLHTYLQAFEAIERSLEDVDARAMQGEIASHESVIVQLVSFRREIGKLRRALASHRETILALTRPELEALGDEHSAARFETLRGRLEEAVQAARDSREAVVGSFDVVIASTGQRTNEIMKVLTIASVLLLPGALLAGLMGMNFDVFLFHYDWMFWGVLAVVGVSIALTLLAAHMRDWI
jgi:magnesium transporter